MQIKIFEASCKETLEQEVNSWLDAYGPHSVEIEINVSHTPYNYQEYEENGLLLKFGIHDNYTAVVKYLEK